MIQRIQTVYLLLAVVASICCLSMPVGTYAGSDGALVATAFNLWLTLEEGGHAFAPWPLFAVLLVQAVLAAYAIFGYANRRAQARLCAFDALLVVGWYIVFAVEALAVGCGVGETRFVPSWQCALPLVSLVFTLLARRAILADERLVRAADRIR